MDGYLFILPRVLLLSVALAVLFLVLGITSLLSKVIATLFFGVAFLYSVVVVRFKALRWGRFRAG